MSDTGCMHVSAQCWNRTHNGHTVLVRVETFWTGKHDCASRLTKSSLCVRVFVREFLWVTECAGRLKTLRAGAALQVWAHRNSTPFFNVVQSLAPSSAYCKSRWAELNNKCSPFPEEIRVHKQPERELFLHQWKSECRIRTALAAISAGPLPRIMALNYWELKLLKATFSAAQMPRGLFVYFFKVSYLNYLKVFF